MISVIIPVYKAEAYLKRCMDSLLAQSLKDFEVILVDDESPDKSGDICDNYMQNAPSFGFKEYQIKVFHKKHGGVSAARQFGLNHATGEYVIQADPDDWVEPTMLEELYKKAKIENADMVICDFYAGSASSWKYCKQEPKSLNNMDLMVDLFRNLHGSTWNKLVRTDTIRKYHAQFPIGLNLCEDVYFNVELLKHPLKVVYLPKAFYHYDLSMNQNSMVRKPRRDSIDSLVCFIDHFQPLWDKMQLKDVEHKYKFWVKKQMFYSGQYSPEEMLEKYSECNTDFKQKSKMEWYSQPEMKQIWMSMNGYPRLGYLYMRLIFAMHRVIKPRKK